MVVVVIVVVPAVGCYCCWSFPPTNGPLLLELLQPRPPCGEQFLSQKLAQVPYFLFRPRLQAHSPLPSPLLCILPAVCSPLLGLLPRHDQIAPLLGTGQEDKGERNFKLTSPRHAERFTSLTMWRWLQ